MKLLYWSFSFINNFSTSNVLLVYINLSLVLNIIYNSTNSKKFITLNINYNLLFMLACSTISFTYTFLGIKTYLSSKSYLLFDFSNSSIINSKNKINSTRDNKSLYLIKKLCKSLNSTILILECIITPIICLLIT